MHELSGRLVLVNHWFVPSYLIAIIVFAILFSLIKCV